MARMLSLEQIRYQEEEGTQEGIRATKQLMLSTTASGCSFFITKLYQRKNTTLYGYTALESASSSQEINTSQSELIEKKKMTGFLSQGINRN